MIYYHASNYKIEDLLKFRPGIDETFMWDAKISNNTFSCDKNDDLVQSILNQINICKNQKDYSLMNNTYFKDTRYFSQQFKDKKRDGSLYTNSLYYASSLAHELYRRIELIFEDIRINDFINLPSRKNSIFLFDQNIPNIKHYLQLMAIHNKKYIYEINIIEPSKIYYANLNHFKCKPNDVLNIKNQAKKYWSNNETYYIEKSEILYNGKFEIFSQKILK